MGEIMLIRSLQVFAVSSFMSLSLMAKELRLATITSDMDSNSAVLIYDLNEITGSIDHFYQETYENGKFATREELKIDGLTNGGIILLKKDKFNIVRIWSDNFDREQGGVLYLDTLYSALSGERREYEMDVVKGGEGLVLLNSKKEFDKMKFVAKRSKVFGVIGIEKIQFSK